MYDPRSTLWKKMRLSSAGQSTHSNENMMKALRTDGMQAKLAHLEYKGGLATTAMAGCNCFSQELPSSKSDLQSHYGSCAVAGMLSLVSWHFETWPGVES